MVDIILFYIIFKYFYEIVKLFKMNEYKIYLFVNLIEVCFDYSEIESRVVIFKRFE